MKNLSYKDEDISTLSFFSTVPSSFGRHLPSCAKIHFWQHLPMPFGHKAYIKETEGHINT